jgi:hypothetical protein
MEDKEGEQADRIVKSFNKGVEHIKSDVKSIDKQTIFLGLMFLAVCIFFFFLGYYFGNHNATIECNKIIIENQIVNLTPSFIFG